MSTFKALRVYEGENKTFSMRVEERQLKDLPAGDVLIRVKYSSLNYKDSLSAKGNRGVTRQYPHTPGIDAAGVVVESQSAAFQEGDEVIVTGYDLGMNTSGGFSHYIRVPAGWVARMPVGWNARDAMIMGTAGLTAALCVDTLVTVGLPDGEVLVTGATGGVGSIAVILLAAQGYEIVAATGKPDSHSFLQLIGAKTVIDRSELLAGTEKALLKERWAGVVDTVGGDILFNAVKATKYSGSIACCGNVASPNFQGNVFPFILRGVNLMGVDSVELPLHIKEDMWNLLAQDWNYPMFNNLVNEISLEQLPAKIEQIHRGENVGRVLINLDR